MACETLTGGQQTDSHAPTALTPSLTDLRLQAEGGGTGAAIEGEAGRRKNEGGDRGVLNAPSLERSHVHDVYNVIAPHFSSTRYARWPKVAEFLEALPPGTLLLDAGCGNGKYLGFNDKCFNFGCDISAPLVGICASRGFDVGVADAVHLPIRRSSFDAAISIAVLHHLSTDARRIRALSELVRAVRIGGRVLITVWAREQEDPLLLAKWTPLTGQHVERWVDDAEEPPLTPGRQLAASSALLPIISEQASDTTKSVEEEAHPQTPDVPSDLNSDDPSPVGSNGQMPLEPLSVSSLPLPLPSSPSPSSSLYTYQTDRSLIPVVLPSISPSVPSSTLYPSPSRSPFSSPCSIPDTTRAPLAHRLSRALADSGQSPSASSTPSAGGQEYLVPWHVPYHRAEVGGCARMLASGQARKDDRKGAVVFNRYYHVFVEGEIERLANQVAGAAIVDRFFDKSNWCVVLEKTEEEGRS
eukprot:TRINITY_DN26921_c0_g1_i1.p1 TRINITY_DN26921_c0_g1~~TRINITY_DN26921_c0_g1_i1.p1  ORF type:complete len:485 (-),score=87.11 TRINITY_DN26921_c0_g1_i1:860-2269(-)